MGLRIDLCSYDAANLASGPLAWLARMPSEWRKRGLEVRVRLFSWQNFERGATFVALREAGFEVTSTVFRDTATNVRWLLEQARESPPDLFVANHVVPAWYAGAYFRPAGIPTVGILRSDDAFYHDLIRQFVSGARPFRPSAIVAVSHLLVESVEKARTPETRVRWIPSGTPLPPMRTPSSQPSHFRVAYVGRFVEEQKCFRETVEALIRTTREIRGAEAVLYGDGPERAYLEERLGASDAAGVKFGGSLAAEQIPGKLRECQAIVLLSDYEGTPTALMEGMAAGCVPVCTRIRSGIPELVEDGVNGILVDDRGDSFLSAIRRLRDDPALRERLALAARRRIEEDYALDVCADRWVDFLNELHLSAGPRRPIRLPRFLHLPKPLPGFAHQDLRISPTRERLRRGYVKARVWAGRVRRKVVG